MAETKTKKQKQNKAANQPVESVGDGKVEGPSSSIKFYIDKHDPKNQTHRALFMESSNTV